MGTPLPETAPDSRRWKALAFIALAQLMVVLDATIVNIALPAAQQDLGLSDGNKQWVITAYALAFGGLLLFGGRIADLWGRKRTFVTGLIGFALASALGGAAANEANMASIALTLKRIGELQEHAIVRPTPRTNIVLRLEAVRKASPRCQSCRRADRRAHHECRTGDGTVQGVAVAGWATDNAFRNEGHGVRPILMSGKLQGF